MNAVYLRYELLRLFRNRQSFVFSLVVPLVVFLAVGGSNRDVKPYGNDVTLARYYLAGMIALGTMAAVFTGGARIAFERQVGWNRQLRLTPLAAGTYLRVKVLTSYLIAVLVIVLLTAAALAIGVSLHPADWLEAVGLTLVALVPFAAFGIGIGHLVKGDAMGPVIGLGVSFFAILGGAYFPLGGDHGFLHELVRVIPSFWLVQAGKTGIGGESWTVEAWLVVVGWAVVLGAGAMWAYRRDTARA
ncbi:ABC-2 type transport system permease protein [Jatrophihabitans endophyticus]|uniref:ABC-2 type transport system permease protein n=1 Tax=Jatrophihabitans endophyticus TaxID=1206085 RepID=A0A1M5R740_9ACTN|nr:ABC transporter permease [Jatrophihabitans endophyticus]SHH22185.1 ABC-2 type transport system permease protein [Jatrophihabitans endophyticus]